MNPYHEIIDSLSECIPACEKCAKACLEEENIKPMVACIKLTKECASICSLGVRLLSGESELSETFIGFCADICSKCTGECEKHEQDHCKECAEVCRQCQEICNEFLVDRRQAAMNA